MDQKSIPSDEEELRANVEIESDTVLTQNGERKEITLSIPARTRFGGWAGMTTWLSAAFNAQAGSLRDSSEDLLEKGNFGIEQARLQRFDRKQTGRRIHTDECADEHPGEDVLEKPHA